MFERIEENLKETQAKSEARRMLADMMAEMLLESDASEAVKLGVRVTLKARDISETIKNEIVMKYASPKKHANAETLKYVLDYLSLVEVGLKQFAETTPFVADDEEEEDE